MHRICTIANHNIHFDEDDCFPDVQTVAELLIQNGLFDFNISDDVVSQRNNLITAGMDEEKIDKLLKK